MTPLGLTGPGAAPAADPAKPVPEIDLHFEEVLASAHRVWVRGRVIAPQTAGNRAAPEPRWWERWRRRLPAHEGAPEARLETRVGGHVLEATVPIRADGTFEAAFATELPPTRRGWRMARNRLALLDRTTEKCAVVLHPPSGVQAAAVVVLPLDVTATPGGMERFIRSEQAARLGRILLRLQQQSPGAGAFYYLAVAPREAEVSPAELALAATTLGWPHGSIVLLTAEAEAGCGRLAEGMDRLRWLFAGSLELYVVNLEPGLAGAWVPEQEPQNDRASVRRVVHPGDDLESLLESDTEKVPRSGVFLRPTRAGLVPRYPVVFCHGMLAFTTLRMQLPEDHNSFRSLRPFLLERGFRVLYPQVLPTGGVTARAEQLRDQIRHWTDEPVNIIAHSMGGLDARFLITHLGMADRVRSLTTIATPHRGTYLVEWFLANYRQRVPLLLALEAMGLNMDGFQDCRPDTCRRFNERTPDMPGVRYFSFGGAVPMGHVTPVLRRAWNLLTTVEGPNDGMVSLASARWGEYLGTVHADHFAQTPDMAGVRPGEDFDALGFYTRLVENLARRGF
jgi:triacylglycerol lipase